MIFPPKTRFSRGRSHERTTGYLQQKGDVNRSGNCKVKEVPNNYRNLVSFYFFNDNKHLEYVNTLNNIYFSVPFGRINMERLITISFAIQNTKTDPEIKQTM